MKKFKWRSGYKYQCAEDFTFNTDAKPLIDVEDDFVSLSASGLLTVKKGYAWDGPSGPTFDTKNSMRASCKHDALSQLMRKGLLSRHLREVIDGEFYSELLSAGMFKFRAWYWFEGVRKFASSSVMAKSVKKVFSD